MTATGSPTAQAHPDLEHQRPLLALEKNSLAVERTLMAWIRTALSMISFGFTIGKIGQALEGGEFKNLLGRERSVEGIALFLVVLGTTVMLGAAIQYKMRIRKLRRLGLTHEWSMAFVVSILLSLGGALALTALLLQI